MIHTANAPAGEDTPRRGLNFNTAGEINAASPGIVRLINVATAPVFKLDPGSRSA